MPQELVVNCVGNRWIIIDRQGKDTVLHVMYKEKRLASLVLEKAEAVKLAAHIDLATRRKARG